MRVRCSSVVNAAVWNEVARSAGTWQCEGSNVVDAQCGNAQRDNAQHGSLVTVHA